VSADWHCLPPNWASYLIQTFYYIRLKFYFLNPMDDDGEAKSCDPDDGVNEDDGASSRVGHSPRLFIS